MSWICPHCDIELELEEYELGDKGKCKGCNSEYEIDFDCDYPEDAVLIPWWKDKKK